MIPVQRLRELRSLQREGRSTAAFNIELADTLRDHADALLDSYEREGARDSAFLIAAREAIAERDHLKAVLTQVIELLKSIRAWDHMDTAADGAFWRGEIDRVVTHG